MSIQEYREGHTVWLARLSNNEEVCMYDIDNVDTWKELKNRVINENLSIISLSLQFRSNTVNLPPNMPGYVFCKGVLASTTRCLDLYTIGYLLDDGSVKIKQYIVPELIEWEEIIREKSECPTLITNQYLEQLDK
jgi:hypothetical protein